MCGGADHSKPAVKVLDMKQIQTRKNCKMLSGASLMELLISIFVFVLIVVAASAIITSSLNNRKAGHKSVVSHKNRQFNPLIRQCRCRKKFFVFHPAQNQLRIQLHDRHETHGKNKKRRKYFYESKAVFCFLYAHTVINKGFLRSPSQVRFPTNKHIGIARSK